jgi:hypothetical protein
MMNRMIAPTHMSGRSHAIVLASTAASLPFPASYLP